MNFGDKGILPDHQIATLCMPPDEDSQGDFRGMIYPFVPHQVREGGGNLIAPPEGAEEPSMANGFEMVSYRAPIRKIVSYGLSSHGYDVRLDRKFKIFTNINSRVIDPLAFDDKCFVEFEGDECVLPPNSYLMGVTMEAFKIPRDVMAICLGKSTYARCGAIVNVTPIEAGFEGKVVIEISNSTNLPLIIHAGMGIAQFVFFRSQNECSVSYADRGGKYQHQSGVQVAKV